MLYFLLTILFKGVSRADLQTISEIHATTQLLSPRNRMLSLAVYLLETRQLDLLEDWLQLNKASSESSASIDYLEGLCFLNKGQKDSAIESFIGNFSAFIKNKSRASPGQTRYKKEQKKLKLLIQRLLRV